MDVLEPQPHRHGALWIGVHLYIMQRFSFAYAYTLYI